jgi:hypothetical protein
MDRFHDEVFGLLCSWESKWGAFSHLGVHGEVKQRIPPLRA